MQTLEKTLAGGGTAGHDVPELVLEFVEFEGLGDLLWVHGYIGGEEEEEGVNIRFHMGVLIDSLLTFLEILLVREH